MTTSYGKDGIKWFLCVAYDVQADILALKQGSIIFGHCNNPVADFSVASISKNTILTTKSVVNIVFFEMLGNGSCRLECYRHILRK